MPQRIQNAHYFGPHPAVLKQVEKLIERLHPFEVILFGSRARGTHRPQSDFDIAVRLPPQSLALWTSFVVESQESEEVLMPIDWVLLNTAEPALLESIQKEGVLVYGSKHETA